MTLPALILVTAALALVPSGAAAHAPAPASLLLSAAGQRTLKADGVALSTVSPATRQSRTLRLPIVSAKVTSGATVQLAGSLRFTAGKRRLDLGALSLSVGASSIGVSGKAGRSALKLFAVTPTRPATLDPTAGSVSLVGARFALTKAAAARLKSALKLRRAPSTKTLGTLQAVWAPDDHTPAVVPVPQPIVTTPAATATATPTPVPGPRCPDFAATPAGSVDWFACDLPGAADLHSWTDYVQRRLPGPCPFQPGSVTESGGAARLDPASAYDHRFPIDSVTEPGGKLTIQVHGAVAYAMPVHGIDEQISDLKIELDGGHGAVYADGYSKAFDMSAGACAAAPLTYTGQKVLELDLTGIQPVTSGGVKRWVHVPAAVVAGADRIGGGQYADRPWGSFTIAVAP